jgi:acetylornithine deacetylase/succinyl-diaminopimelate desuccinylase family protein
VLLDKKSLYILINKILTMYRTVVESVNRCELIDFLSELVRIPSMPGSEEAVAVIIEKKLRELGFNVQLLPSFKGRPNLLGTLEGKNKSPTLWFNGHMDVLPPGMGWEAEPFGAHVINGNLYGRGSVDMKAGIAAMIIAASTIVRNGITLGGTLGINVVSDEVAGGYEGSGYVVREQILKNKIKRPDMVVICEPTGDEVRIAHRGAIWLELEAIGRSAHGGRPWLGINAISKMARIITKLESEYPLLLSHKRHRMLPSPNFNIGVISGGSRPNLVPDHCAIQIDRRTLPGETAEEVIDEIITIIGRDEFDMTKTIYPLKIRTIMEIEACEVSPEERIVKECVKAYKEIIGKEPRIGYTAGFEDAHFFVNEAKIPTAMFGPYKSGKYEEGEDTTSGSNHENVNIDSVITAAKIYTRMILNILL